MSRADGIKEQEEFDGVPFSKEEKAFYESLFAELEKEPELSIPHSFSEKVARKAYKRANIWQDVKLYAFYSVLFVCLVGLCVLFFALDTSTSGQKNFQNLTWFFSLSLVASLVYFVVQILDRILVKGE